METVAQSAAGCAVEKISANLREMIIDLTVHLGSEGLCALEIKGEVPHCTRAHLSVPG